MIWLSEADMRRAVSPDGLMDGIEEAFRLYHLGAFHMPDRYSVTHRNKTMLYMPCCAGGVIGTKLLAEFPENPARGLPYLSGLMVLNDQDTGAPLAVMNGTALTALRTGAVGGVAVRHLSRPDSSRTGLVGCGVQGFHQLLYACAARPIREIFLYNRPGKDLRLFADRLRGALDRDVEVRVCPDVRELTACSDIVITATQARSPVLPDDPELLRGRCYVAIGSWQPDMRELPDGLWRAAGHVYTELPFALEESGDLSQPLASGVLSPEQVRYMSDFLWGGGPRRPEETEVYKSVGMGIFDAVAAKVILDGALALGLGQELEL